MKNEDKLNKFKDIIILQFKYFLQSMMGVRDKWWSDTKTTGSMDCLKRKIYTSAKMSLRTKTTS